MFIRLKAGRSEKPEFVPDADLGDVTAHYICEKCGAEFAEVP